MGACPSCDFTNAADTYFCGRCQLYLRTLGEYRLTRAVGKGGFASVFLAEHVETGTPAAVKILHREFVERDDIKERFAREAQVMMELDHPHIVKLYDYGELDDATLGVYLTMEWCPGQTLGQAVAAAPHRRFSVSQTQHYTEQLLSGLKHIHDRGVVHRDLKPNNLMLVENGGQIDLKILDFGLAWVDGKALTRSDVVIGSLMFMSPEQIRGRKDLYGPSTDLYAVGLLLAWMLTGSHVFGDVTREQIMVHHVLETPPTLGQLCPEIPWSPSLEALVAKALHKDPLERFASAAQLLTAMKRAEWPDFAHASTLPSVSLDSAPALSPYEDTGLLAPTDQDVLAAASTPLVGHGPGLGRDTEESWASHEGAPRPRRRSRGKPLIGFVFLAFLAAGAWWGMREQPVAPAPSPALVADASAQPEPRRAAPMPPMKLGILVPGKPLPPAVADLLQRWRQAWLQTAEKPYQTAAGDALFAMYHENFRDMTSKASRRAAVDAMIQRAQNSRWMKLDLSQVFVHASSPRKLVVQFRQKCFGSTMRAAGTDKLTGSIYVDEGLVMLEWRKDGDKWQIWRAFRHPISATGAAKP